MVRRNFVARIRRPVGQSRRHLVTRIRRGGGPSSSPRTSGKPKLRRRWTRTYMYIQFPPFFFGLRARAHTTLQLFRPSPSSRLAGWQRAASKQRRSITAPTAIPFDPSCRDPHRDLLKRTLASPAASDGNVPFRRCPQGRAGNYPRPSSRLWTVAALRAAGHVRSHARPLSVAAVAALQLCRVCVYREKLRLCGRGPSLGPVARR